MRCFPPPSSAPVVGLFVSKPPTRIHSYLVGVGEGSGEDSGDEGERPTKEDDEDEDDDDIGTANSPVGLFHHSRHAVLMTFLSSMSEAPLQNQHSS
jgi:hypothetical protein